MLITILVGVGLGAAGMVLFAAAALGCFVLTFGLYWYGWLLREHELWRERRGQEAL